MPKILTLPQALIRERLVLVFEKAGVSAADSLKLSDILIENERSGYPSHGIMRAVDYVQDIKLCRADATALPVVEHLNELCTNIDGNNSLGIKVIDALEKTCGMIRSQSKLVYFVTVRNAHHLGRLATIARLFCNHGYFIQGFENYNGHGQKIMPKGSGQGRLATNPIVFGIPMEDGLSIIFDMATSVVSEGAVRMCYNENKKVPVGWLIDTEGKPVTDPAMFYAQPMRAFLSPLGGIAEHKGFGLGLMAEIFSTVFSGSGNISAPAVYGGNSAFFVLYRAEVFGLSLNEVSQRARSICDFAVAGNDLVRIPGVKMPEATDNINISAKLWKNLEDLCT